MEVIWWTFFIILFPFLGDRGEAYVETRGTKVSWIPHHTGDILLYVQQEITTGGGGGGVIINNQTGAILFHIYPLFNNNLHIKYRSSKTSSQSRQIHNKGKNNHQFFINGAQYKKVNFWLFGWPMNNRTGSIMLPSYPHLYQYIYKIWKQSDKDFVSYRENGEVSADAAAT